MREVGMVLAEGEAIDIKELEKQIIRILLCRCAFNYTVVDRLDTSKYCAMYHVQDISLDLVDKNGYHFRLKDIEREDVLELITAVVARGRETALDLLQSIAYINDSLASLERFGGEIQKGA